MSATADLRTRRTAVRRTRGMRALAREQLAVAGGQAAAGAGNLLFSLVAARVLAPGSFAQLTAFLALYLVIHVPAASLSAGSALEPALAARLRRRVLAIGGLAGAVLAIAAVPAGAALGLSPGLLLAAAAAAPTAGLIALDRGRLYGLGRRARVVGSLLAEPTVRLALGVPMAALAGPVGAAATVVAAGWLALAVAHLPAQRAPQRRFARPSPDARRARRAAATDGEAAATATGRGRLTRDAATTTAGGGRPTRDAAATATGRGRPTAAVVAFLLLAVVQNQDVLFANALLPAGEAGRFAVVSTLGGVAALATTTVPLVLLPRAGAHGRDALRVALAVAALAGAAAVAVVAVSPATLAGAVFGERYAAAGAIAVPYVLAMALLGVARVLVAHACTARPAAHLAGVLGAVAVLQAVLIVLLGHDAGGVATATLIATTALTAGAGALAAPPGALRLPALWLPSVAALRRPEVAAVAAFTATGLALRLLATRGIWLDEATSIHQAQMSLGGMLEDLRANDVHPPLHHLTLWLVVRVLGTGELAVRLPSLIASTALIPLLYRAGRDVYDRRAGIAAAGLATVAPFAVWYADEARMYAFFMLFALLAAWAQVRVLRDGRRRDWLAWAAAAAALVYTQYFALLFVVVQQLGFVVALAARRRNGRRLRALGLPWLGWSAALAVVTAPLMGFAHAQFAANEAAGKGFEQVPSQTGGALAGATSPPGAYEAITNVAWAVLGYHSDATMKAIAALWPLLLLLALALLGRGRSPRTLLLAACAILPAALLFALGQLKPFVFEVRYFVGAVPLALLLLARAATSWTVRPAPAFAACGVAAVAMAAGLADQQLNGSNPRVYDFEGAVHAVEARARPGDVLVYAPPYLGQVIAYYDRDRIRARPLGSRPPEPRRGRRVFVLASFLDKPQFRQATEQAVRRLDRRHRLVWRDSRPQIRIWEFR